MPHPSERLAGWLSLKWFVIAAAIVADGLLLSYDLRIGLAASTLLGLVAAGWLYIALRYGSLSGNASVRTLPVERARQQENLRRMAALRSGAQQRPNPDEGA